MTSKCHEKCKNRREFILIFTCSKANNQQVKGLLNNSKTQGASVSEKHSPEV